MTGPEKAAPKARPSPYVTQPFPKEAPVTQSTNEVVSQVMANTRTLDLHQQPLKQSVRK